MKKRMSIRMDSQGRVWILEVLLLVITKS